MNKRIIEELDRWVCYFSFMGKWIAAGWDKEITNEITFLELCKQNQGIATKQSPEIFHTKL